MLKEYGKPIVAYVDEMACSAAYCLASACDEMWGPEAMHVGSVGVILCTIDETESLEKAGIKVRYVVSGKRKADLHPGNPVDAAVLAAAQEKVDILAEQFFSLVAKARGRTGPLSTPEAVKALQASVYVGADAVRVGLADGVASWGRFLSLLRGSLSASRELTDQSVSRARTPGRAAGARARR
jgi:ClpP class serine protease